MLEFELFFAHMDFDILFAWGVMVIILQKMRKLAFVSHRNRNCMCLFRVFNTKLGVDSKTRPMTLFIWGVVNSDEP